jgi:hypothetical protein
MQGGRAIPSRRKPLSSARPLVSLGGRLTPYLQDAAELS